MYVLVYIGRGTGLTETELQSLVSLSLLLRGSKVTVDEVQKTRLGAEDVLPSLQMLRLIRSLRCFLRPHPSTRLAAAALISNFTLVK